MFTRINWEESNIKIVIHFEFEMHVEVGSKKKMETNSNINQQPLYQIA